MQPTISPRPFQLRPARAAAGRRRRASLLTLAAALAVLALAGCGPRGTEETTAEPLPAGSNILLITVDTLRADHLSSYGYPRETSPTIDRLAAEGVRFEAAAVQWPKTGPSFASMFTGTYGKDNGIVRKIGIPLPCKFEMLAELLQRQGYTTHAVVANGAVGSDFYFDQGFDSYLEPWKMEIPPGQDPVGAETITTLATGLLDRIEAAGKPYFLWVHYIDPHTPYEPPAGPVRDRFQGDEHYDPSEKIEIFPEPKRQMLGIGTEQVLDGRDEMAFYVARYDAEIAYADAQIARLLDTMEERGLLEETLTVFTSDHGESLGEHGYYFDHGRFGFETCLNVPLIVHYPGVVEPRVDPYPVEVMDIAPTILEAAGVSLDQGPAVGLWMQAESLTPRLRGAEPLRADDGHVYAFSEAGYETANKWQKIVRDERFKLVYAQTAPAQRWYGGQGVRFTLYDLEADPGETVNVAEQFPEDLERLKRALAAWERAEQFPVLLDTVGCGDENRTMDAETEELLRSLGYL